ncbi:hypothetical protein NG01_11225, partial [Corynebacterium diphtheriae]
QLVEHLLCKQKVRSSILLCSTVWDPAGEAGFFLFCVPFFRLLELETTKTAGRLLCRAGAVLGFS